MSRSFDGNVSLDGEKQIFLFVEYGMRVCPYRKEWNSVCIDGEWKGVVGHDEMYVRYEVSVWSLSSFNNLKSKDMAVS